MSLDIEDLCLIRRHHLKPEVAHDHLVLKPPCISEEGFDSHTLLFELIPVNQSLRCATNERGLMEGTTLTISNLIVV